MTVDFHDSEQLMKYAQETVELSEQYKTSRSTYATAKMTLDVALAKAFAAEEIKESLSYEKALLKLIEKDDGLKADYEIMQSEEANYKGTEKVIEARKAYVSLYQSLVKNKIQEVGDVS